MAAVPNRTTISNQCLRCRQLEASLREGSGFPKEHSRAPDDLSMGIGVKGRIYIIFLCCYILLNLQQKLQTRTAGMVPSWFQEDQRLEALNAKAFQEELLTKFSNSGTQA